METKKIAVALVIAMFLLVGMLAGLPGVKGDAPTNELQAAGKKGNAHTQYLLTDGSGVTRGFLDVWNDQKNLYVKFSTVSGEATIYRSFFAVADSPDGIPTMLGTPNVIEFPYQTRHPGAYVAADLFTITMKKATPGTTLYLSAYSEMGIPLTPVRVQSEPNNIFAYTTQSWSHIG